MIRKYATLETLSSSFAKNSLSKSAHRADFSRVPVRPGYLYVRSRAISSRTNDNFDTFPAEEIKKGYLSFIGKPVFVNHENENHRRARGVILDAQLHEDRNPDGSADTWVEVLMEVDAIRFPKLAEAIVKGHIERTSMGVDVEMSECGVCHNEARTPMQYCAHIPRMKGSKIRQVTASGTQQDVLVHEVCYGLAFFENSLLVEEPADPTAYFLGVDTSGLEMQATKRAIATRKNAQQFTSLVNEMVPGVCYIANTGSGGEVKLLLGVTFDTEQEADRFAGYFPKYLNFYVKGYGEDPTKTLMTSLPVIYYGSAGSTPNSNGVKYYNRLMKGIDESGVRVEWLCNKTYIENLIEDTLDRCSPEYRAEFPDLYYSYASRKPRAFGGRRVSSLSKTANKMGAPGSDKKCALCGHDKGDHDGRCYAASWCQCGAFHTQGPDGYLKLGYGEIVAPPAVDTLRQEECPICGGDQYNGDQCLVCGFIKPPEMYMDPDLGAAGLNDLREEQGLTGVDPSMDPNAMSGDMTPGLDTNNPVVENVLAGDVQELACDSCGALFDYDPTQAHAPGPVEQVSQQVSEPPMANPANDGPVAPGSALGDVPPPPPNNSTDEQPGNEEADPEPPAGEELPKSEKDSNDETHDDPEAQVEDETKTPAEDSSKEEPAKSDDAPDGSEDDDTSAGEGFESLNPGDSCPECGGGTLGHPTEDNPLNATDENPDPDHDGDDDRLGSEDDPDHAEEEQEVYDEIVDDEEDEDEEDEDKKSKSASYQSRRKSNKEVKTRRTSNTAGRRSQKEQSMARPVIAAVSEQQKMIKRQAMEIASLKKAIARIERLAGIRSTADAANPAQPIPQPGGGAAYPGSSLDESRTPGARGRVDEIGGVADTTNVGAYTTDSVDNIGLSSPSGYNITQDVTTPIAGTETMRPLDEVRTRPVIEFGNPLKPDFAFPLEGDFAQRATVGSEARIYASLRLARLRIEAGTAETSDDDVAEAEAINTDESKSDEDIQNEIETTSKILKAQGRKQTRTASRNLVPKARAGRQVPSVAKAGGISTVASQATPAGDDPFLFI